MSRIGRMPIAIPPQVQVEIKPGCVKAKGPLGENSLSFPEAVAAEIKEGHILVLLRGGAGREDRALHGTIRARLANLVQGVALGFTKTLEVQGLGFRVAVGNTGALSMNLGYSHPVIFQIPKGIRVQVDPKQTLITISGFDKDSVGEAAARIRHVRLPEPYKGTGIRYQGEHIARKAGKTAAGVGAGAAGGGAKK